jgi:hypothetical protein
MSNERKYREKPVRPKALVCGLLEDNGRFLFLTKKDQHGVERYELPWVYSTDRGDPVSQIGQAFKMQSGISVQVGEIVLEARHNAGSRRKRFWVQCYVFRVSAKEMKADPGESYSGYKWLSLKDAKEKKLGKHSEWIKFVEKI